MKRWKITYWFELDNESGITESTVECSLTLRLVNFEVVGKRCTDWSQSRPDATGGGGGCGSDGVFPRNVSILMYARWSSLVTVPEARTAAISTLCRFHVHTPPETKYTALASRSSTVQLLKWRDRWHYYLRSVANVCIFFMAQVNGKRWVGVL
jgi:hypothetical protein